MSEREKQTAKIIPFKVSKTAAGGGGNSTGGCLYKPGHNIICKIISKQPDGYEVVIPKDGITAFLFSDNDCKINQEVLTQFVGIEKGKIILKRRY